MKSPLEKLIEDVARRVLGRVHERTAGVNRSAYATPLYDEMNSEAGQMGDAWTDKEANRYGAQLEKIDRKIEKLIVARQAIETQLAY